MKNEVLNKFKKDFLSLGERVGKVSTQHPEQLIQEAWVKWRTECGSLGDWYDAFKNWRKGVLKGYTLKTRTQLGHEKKDVRL